MGLEPVPWNWSKLWRGSKYSPEGAVVIGVFSIIVALSLIVATLLFGYGIRGSGLGPRSTAYVVGSGFVSDGGAWDRVGHTSASLLWWKPGTAGEFQDQIFQDQIFQDQIVVRLSHSRSQASSIRAYAWISSALKNSEISRLALSAESEP